MNKHPSSLPRRDFLRSCALAGAGLASGIHYSLARAIPACLVTGTPMMDNIVVGLDIGSSKVCAAVAERRPDGTIWLLGIGEAPSHASKWGIVDPEGTRRSVREALVNAEINTDMMIGSVVLGLKPGPKGRLRNPYSIVDFVQQHEEHPFAQALFDADAIQDLHRMADFAYEQEQALLLDLHGDGLLPRRHCAEFWNEDALVQIEQGALSAVASAKAVLSPDDKQRGALVIDMGAGTTEFCAVTGEYVYPDCIQVGGRYLAIDVPPGLVSRLDQLEKLFANANHAGPGECRAAGCVGASSKQRRDRSLERFDSMRVMHTFELVKARLELNGIGLDSLRAGVHLTGGYSVVPGVREFAECFLGIPAQIGRVKGILGPASVLADTRYSCALGLVKSGHFRPQK